MSAYFNPTIAALTVRATLGRRRAFLFAIPAVVLIALTLVLRASRSGDALWPDRVLGDFGFSVLLPFTALRRAFPRSATCTGAHRSVALLVEMLADDRALRGRPTHELVSALVRFGTAGTCPAPAGALAAAEGEVVARVSRLLQPVRPLPTAAVLAICLAAALLVAAPITLLIV